MTEVPDKNKSSLKSQMVGLLDQFLLGYVSAKDLINATVPMLMLSGHKRGRKNYIEKFLMEIASKPESELTRDYIYNIREIILGEMSFNEKDRKKVLRRTIKKLLERYLFDEIDVPYFLSTLYDLLCDFHLEIEEEKPVKKFFDEIYLLAGHIQRINDSSDYSSVDEETLTHLISEFYNNNFKTLWDEKE
jgi:hypothetical protein